MDQTRYKDSLESKNCSIIGSALGLYGDFDPSLVSLFKQLYTADDTNNLLPFDDKQICRIQLINKQLWKHLYTYQKLVHMYSCPTSLITTKSLFGDLDLLFGIRSFNRNGESYSCDNKRTECVEFLDVIYNKL